MRGYDYDLGVLGGGAAGLTAAAGAARLGAKTLLVEKERVLGGDCLHFGCVPSKTLIHASRVWRLARQTQRLGLPALELPPVDFRQVADRIAAVIARIQKHDSYERFCGLGVRVLFGQARFEDERVLRVEHEQGVERVSARSWLIATGSAASIPSLEGLERTTYLTNRELFSLNRLPASLLILGGGAIAVEMAQAFQRLGSSVTIVQRSERILSKEDADLADLVQDALDAEGVSVRCGMRAVRARDLNGRPEIDARGPQGEETLRADALLVALGRAPNVLGLGLENAGVRFASSGIPVDARMRTNQKHIYAAGDVTGAHQSTHAAGYEAGIVLANAVFRLPRSADYSRMPRCVFSAPELASLGLNEQESKKRGIDYALWTESFENNDRALTEDQAQGLIKLLLDKKGKPLGVHICGPSAGELLAEWIAVFQGKVGLSTLASAVHPYPTLAEINKRVAGNVLAEKIFSEKVKRTLKLFFNLKGRACRLS
jgi:pyruvate/2-oxoglutarate dehydrogenase complex dihydrolipoamide dehydrogenase (E3) component